MRYVTVNKMFYVFIVCASSGKCPINFNRVATRTPARKLVWARSGIACMYFGSRLEKVEKRVREGERKGKKWQRRATICGSCVMEKLASLALAISK